jgi:putative heme iron utilization protein
LVEDLHKSQYSFRIVVVGNGAILETTSELGPLMKLNSSPKTGEALITLSSADQSFEFHLKIAEVSKVALTEKETGDRVMRIIRFLNNVGAPMCSLILRDDSEKSVEWYNELRSTYGGNVQL